MQPDQNLLANELSPYLLQHKDNPVHWLPWTESALKSAREQDRPILLSVGYSACHWCHVMAHESFEDQRTASLMNSLFVNIKVDREERPDLDKIYQLAHQLMTQQGGGWPLTVFLDPKSLNPFFTGTYFPPEPRHGLPGFREILTRVRAYFDQHRDAIERNNQQLTKAFYDLSRSTPHEDDLTAEPIEKGLVRASAIFDHSHGGFGSGPRFPQAPLLEWLADTSSPVAAEMLSVTLEAMIDGGLRDHLGGGFYRYTVDQDWTIPHFEKMLYDNAQLLPLLADYATITGNNGASAAALELVEWLERELASNDGGYFSSLDADTDDGEGAFYVWSKEAIQTALDDDQASDFIVYYGLDQPPNFEGRHWHLRTRRFDADLASGLAPARALLLAQRQQRLAPALDDKQLTGWNALMVSGLVRAGQQLTQPGWVDRAEDVFMHLQATRIIDGTVYSVFKNGETRQLAFLDDVAYFLAAGVDLLGARFSDTLLETVLFLADYLIDQFQCERGGFYFTPHQHESLPTRGPWFQDDATPGGNGIATLAMIRLGHFLGESRYLDAAQGTLRAAWSDIDRSPTAHPSLLRALTEWLSPPSMVILVGDEGEIEQWRQVIPTSGVNTYFIGNKTRHLPGILANYEPQGPMRAYLCQGQTCQPPVSTPGELKQMLEKLSPH